MSYYWQGWHDWRRHNATPLRPGLRVDSTLPGPMIPIETLRTQCEIVAIDPAIDSDHEPTHPDDGQILGYLDAAIEHAEDITGLSIALRTYEYALDGFPCSSPWHHSSAIELPRSPLISVESFYAPEGGSSDGEFDLGDDYTIDNFRVPARLLPVSSWPAMTRSTNAIRIKFRAGYRSGDDYFSTDYDGATNLPSAIKQALLLMTAHFYNNREASAEKALSTIPIGVEALLAPKRTMIGFA